jgi:hypothetical protein
VKEGNETIKTRRKTIMMAKRRAEEDDNDGGGGGKKCLEAPLSHTSSWRGSSRSTRQSSMRCT